ncbi:MAG: hypothetical protein KKG92_05750, partial [Gammaproteobacteria bacterium]|nr:hypothetical protein [Gammaproteobacteria bacterium]
GLDGATQQGFRGQHEYPRGVLQAVEMNPIRHSRERGNPVCRPDQKNNQMNALDSRLRGNDG